MPNESRFRKRPNKFKDGTDFNGISEGYLSPTLKLRSDRHFTRLIIWESNRHLPPIRSPLNCALIGQLVSSIGNVQGAKPNVRLENPISYYSTTQSFGEKIQRHDYLAECERHTGNPSFTNI